MTPAQAVILCGGYGTRLGEMTRETPKPLLRIDGRPFLEILIEELGRQGVSRIVLLAAFAAERIEAFAEGLPERLGMDLAVTTLREPAPAGTGGALWHARAALDPVFLLLNGDSWFDILIADVGATLAANPDALGALALRPVAAADRYGTVRLEDGRIVAFAARSAQDGPGLINGGVYALRREIVDRLAPRGSLESDVLPVLAAEGRLVGIARRGFFLDIGVPDAFAAAQTAIPAQRRRPAVVFDRDGVLNVDLGHVGSASRLEWIPGAREAVRLVNEAGWYAFVVTNQAGIAKGKYTEADYFALRSRMRRDLAAIGAHIDDERYCPMHPEATVARYRGVSDRRKPAPGMLLELRARWPIDWERSLMIGDRETDMAAAAAAALRGRLLEGGDLVDIVRRHISAHATAA